MAEPVVVIADDLTGACEIAGVAWRHGIRAVVTLGSAPSKFDEGALVIDTETRLEPAARAARTLRSIGRAVAKYPGARIFKKTDSALRGPLRAEVETLADALKLEQIVLVPANPGLGRAVQSGRYTINGVPLNETAFARDPHHPARSADVRELLGPEGKRPVLSAQPGRVAEKALIVGDAAEAGDLARWARSVGSDTLAAGSSAFFEQWLFRGAPPRTQNSVAPDFPSPTLMISGTTVSSQRDWIRRLSRVAPLCLETLQDRSVCEHCVADHLVGGESTAVYVDGPLSAEPEIAAKIPEALAEVAALAVNLGLTRHLIVEGGATAAAIVRRFGWDEFKVVFEWQPGVVSLRPTDRPEVTLTLKPGSYPWPEQIAHTFLHDAQPQS